MTLAGIILVTVATIILVAFVFKCDKKEKEPASLLWKLFIFSIFSIQIAIMLEQRLGNVLDVVFSPGMYSDGTYLYFKSQAIKVLYNFVDYFIVVACVEEGAKFLVIYLLTRHHPAFNCTYDGIVYSVICALGFSLIEDVTYILHYNGIQTAIMRLSTEMAGHMFFAAIIGYFYGKSKIYFDAEDVKNRLKANFFYCQDVDYKKKGTKLIWEGYLAAVLIHGTYDFITSFDGTVANIIFWVFVVASTIACIAIIVSQSRKDQYTLKEALNLIIHDNREVSPDAIINALNI